MKIELVYLQTGREQWLDQFLELYVKKINHMVSFELKAIKSPSLARAQGEQKKKLEEQKLVKLISPDFHTIAFDEKGKLFKNSVQFSEKLVKPLEYKKVRFFIGGAYGFTDDFRSQVDELWSLSPLTMNHHLALSTSVEQIYRALSIWKGLPYHNS